MSLSAHTLTQGPLPKHRTFLAPATAVQVGWPSSVITSAAAKPQPCCPSTASVPGARRPSRYQATCAERGASLRCSAYGKGSRTGGDSDSNYYQLLGVDPDCDEEDIRVAFRRRAKELHPDVNKEAGATEAFVQLSRAYEVLSDAESRRQYDITHRTRRLNFFRDVEDDEADDVRRGSPFSWSHVGQRQRRGGGLRPSDDDDDDDRRREDDAEDEEDEEDGGDEAEGPGWQRRRSQEELLEELAKFMSGPGSLRAFQSGRLDPWGTSTSDAWFRQVERQTRNPYGPSRQGYGSSGDDDDAGFGGGGSEWDPSRRTPGWSPPGRGSEWNHPRRQWDEEDRRGGGPGRQGGGGGGDFRRPFKI